MKTLLILYSGDDWNLEQPSYSERQKVVYPKWSKYCEQREIKLIRANIDWFDGELFKKYWEYQNNKWVKVERNILPNAVYDKARNYDKSNGKIIPDVLSRKIDLSRLCIFINPPEFSFLMDNKLNQYISFGEFMPTTKYIAGGNTISNDDSKYVVIKGLYGSGGNEVKITRESNIKVSDNSIIQEFIDSDVNGELRDFRIVYIEEKPFYALSRITTSDKKMTNASQGARIEFIDLQSIPSKITDIADKINQKLEVFENKIYSIDFIIETESDKPFLMEINTMPGVGVLYENSEMMESYLMEITSYIFNLIHNE